MQLTVAHSSSSSSPAEGLAAAAMLALLLLFAGMLLLLDTQPPAFSTLRICTAMTQWAYSHDNDASKGLCALLAMPMLKKLHVLNAMVM